MTTYGRSSTTGRLNGSMETEYSRLVISVCRNASSLTEVKVSEISFETEETERTWSKRDVVAAEPLAAAIEKKEIEVHIAQEVKSKGRHYQYTFYTKRETLMVLVR